MIDDRSRRRHTAALKATSHLVSRAEEDLRVAKKQRDDRIRKAFAAGLTSREIGKAVGLSHVSVLAIGSTPT